MQLKIIHFAPLNNLTANGILPAVIGLAEAQHKSQNFQVLVVDVSNFQKFDDACSCAVPIVRLKDFKLNQTDIKIVIFHGIYWLPYIRIAKELYTSSIPYVVVPHSGLTGRAQKVRRWKKLFGNLLWFRRFCRRASAVQFLTAGEQAESAKWCKSDFILPNGVNPLSTDGRGNHSNSRVRFLYLGRYDVNQKGLDILVAGLRMISPRAKETCEFIFYGTDFRGGRMFLDEAVDSLISADVNIAVNGPAYGDDKNNAYSEADVCVLTSRFEGHPIGLLEAMSAGLPVFITASTNIASEVADAKAGWVVDLDAPQIARKIDEIVLLSSQQVAQRGHNAAVLARTDYSWSVIVPESLTQYRTIISQVSGSRSKNR